MQPKILFRKDPTNEDEWQIAVDENCPIVDQRTLCQDNLVFGRYSVLPYYKELEEDLKNHGSSLINSYSQHCWIANFDYYEELKAYTPETWMDHDFYKCDHKGPFVVKEKTNSRKLNWDTMMFAKDKNQAVMIGADLMNDPLIFQ